MDQTKISHVHPPANTPPGEGQPHPSDRLWKEREEVVATKYGNALARGLAASDADGEGIERVAAGLAATVALVDRLGSDPEYDGNSETILQRMAPSQLRALVVTLTETMRASSDKLRALQQLIHARDWATSDIVDGEAGTLGTLGVRTELRRDVVRAVQGMRALLTRGGDILRMHEELAALEKLLDLPAQDAPLTKGQLRELRRRVDRDRRVTDAFTKIAETPPATRRRGLRVISSAPKSSRAPASSKKGGRRAA